MKVAFCVEDLNPSGGLTFIFSYANYLSTKNYQVSVISRNITNNHFSEDIGLSEQVKLFNFTDFQHTQVEEVFDLVIGTFWKTFDFLFQINANKYAWFIQSIESRFYKSTQIDDALSALNAQIIDIPVITISDWIANSLKSELRKNPIYTVKNGVNKELFTKSEDLVPSTKTSNLKIVIEGSSAWFKGLRNSILGISASDIQCDVHWFSIDGSYDEELLSLLKSRQNINLIFHSKTIQRQFFAILAASDLFIKSSIVEGLPGPPLEAFHAGCTGIYTFVTGVEEYAIHGENCIVVPFDDPNAISSWIRILDSDRTLLNRLKQGAQKTAREWPSLVTSSIEFENIISIILNDQNSVHVDKDKLRATSLRLTEDNWINQFSKLRSNSEIKSLQISQAAKKFIIENE